MNKVLIMLSTYNGQKYLREQLDSLYAQEGVDIHILVRDDGSTDATISILKEYKEKRGKMTILAEKNVGCAMSFYTLMDYAYEHFTDCDYYAFCDQDDVWKLDKLIFAVQSLKSLKIGLYFCSAQITDSDLNIFETTHFNGKLNLQYVMFRQPALGCTQVLTRDFLGLCNESFVKYKQNKPKYIELHDVWTIWISQFYHTTVIYDDTPHVLYRQHNNNVTSHTKENIFKKINRVMKRKKNHKGLGFDSMNILGNIFRNIMLQNDSYTIDALRKYKKSIWNTVSFAFYMQKYFDQIEIKAMVLYSILSRSY